MSDSDVFDDEISSNVNTTKSIRTKVAIGVFICIAVLCVITATLGFMTIYRDRKYESSDEDNTDNNTRPNIIFMISDGFSPASETFARTMATAGSSISNQTLLPLDYMHVGVVRTYSSMSLITDSAAGATAYACGIKTYNNAIAVNDDIIAQATAMEAAKRLGMTTAIVTTSRITHATPASFSSHMSDREYEEDIADQQAKMQDVDILFGGGLQKYLNRTDGQDLFTVMQERGYETIQTLNEFESDLTMPVIGLFAEQHMSYEIDRIHQNPIQEPSLTEMSIKALDMLKENNNPFFLLIEGARIDMAAHAHDPFTHYLEIMQYQDTISVVKDFVDKNPNTYVISVADHATGGISLGESFFNGTYPDPYMWYPGQLLGQTASTEIMAEMILDAGLDTLNQTVLEYGNIQLTDDEFEYIMYALSISENDERSLRTAIGTIIAGRAEIGWTTPGHTGVDVNLYSYGLKVDTLHGVKQNIDVGNELWEELGFISTMQDITEELKDMKFPPILPPETQPGKKYYGHH